MQVAEHDTPGGKVLHLPELVEQILLQVPESIQSAKEVCKAWRQMIRTSKTLRNASILSPSLSDNIHVRWQMQRAQENSSLPIYPSSLDRKIEIHPKVLRVKAAPGRYSIGELRFDMLKTRKEYGYLLNFSSGNRTPAFHKKRAKFRRCGDCFATLPPCRVIGLRLRWDVHTTTECLVDQPEGVRIRDLVAKAEMMLLQNGYEDSHIPGEVALEGRIAVSTNLG